MNITIPIFSACAIFGLIAALLYHFTVKLPEHQAYCVSHGWEYVTIDRSWACLDPKTRQRSER